LVENFFPFLRANFGKPLAIKGSSRYGFWQTSEIGFGMAVIKWRLAKRRPSSS
jgi:hypothetical protein